MTVGSEVVVKETVIIVDGGKVQTLLPGTNGIVKRVDGHTVALLCDDAIYPDIPIQSVEERK